MINSLLKSYFETILTINGSMQDVFTCFTDSDQWAHWMPNVKKIDIAEGVRMQPGCLTTILVEQNGRRVLIKEELIDIQANKYLTIFLRHQFHTCKSHIQFVNQGGITKIWIKNELEWKRFLFILLSFPLKQLLKKTQLDELQLFKKYFESKH